MKRLLSLFCVMILIFVSSVVSDDDYYYLYDEVVPITIDSSKLMVYLTGIVLDDAPAFIESSFSEVISLSDFQPNFGGFFLLDVHTYVSLDNAKQVLLQNENVAIVNSVGLFEGYNFYWGKTFYFKIHPGVSEMLIDSLADFYNLQRTFEEYDEERVYVFDLTESSPLPLLQTANMFADMDITEFAQPNFQHHITLDDYHVEDEYYHLYQDHLKRVVQELAPGYGAWEITTGDSSIMVAVIDQTIETHEEFPQNRMFWGYDLFSRHVDFFFPGSGQYDAHGMAVSGIIGAEHNNVVDTYTSDGQYIGSTYSSTAGIAPGCKLMSVRISKWSNEIENNVFVTDLEIALGIMYAWKGGADIINCCWSRRGDVEPLINAQLDSAITFGRDGLGCPVIFTAGNFGNVHNWTIGWPNHKENVITVGAINLGDSLYDYSCYGSALDIVGPSGYQIPYDTTRPYAGGVWTVDRMGEFGYNPNVWSRCDPDNDLDYTCSFSGTSAAAPLVTGTAALILSIRPDLTADEVYTILKESAVRDLDWGTLETVPHERYGYGRVNAYRALLSLKHGDNNADGTINVADAVYLLNYIIKGGPEPQPERFIGDATCDGSVNIGDAIFLVNYALKGGPAPEICFEY